MAKKSGLTVVQDKTREFNSAIKTLLEEAVYVGVPQATDGRKDGGAIGNATIGYINENGSAAAHIPARPHLSKGVSDVQKVLAEEFGAGAKALFNGRPDAVRTSYNRAGLLAQQSVQRVITQQEGFAPLAESTIKARQNRKKAPRKGTKALIDRGEYRQSIKYVIRKKDAAK